MEHEIEIILTGRKYAANYRGDLIGCWRSPETEGARWLKDHGAADADTLITTRNGRPAMRGNVGWLAAHSVLENERVSPRWVKYRPFATPAGVGSAQDGLHEVFGTQAAGAAAAA